MYSSKLVQHNVYNIVKEPGRLNVSQIFRLSEFVQEVVIVRDTLINKTSSKKF